MGQTIDVTILVDEAHKKHLAKLAKELAGKGFVLKETLSEIGVLVGSVPSTAYAAVSKTPGVSSIEKNRTDYRTQD
jgi:hypothetical protein